MPLVAGAVVVLGAWCGWASGFHTDTPGAWWTWLVSLLAVLAVWVYRWRRFGGGRRTAATAPSTGWAVMPWVALGTVVVVWEVLGIATGPHEPHLTVSALSQAFRPFHAVALAGWILLGMGAAVAAHPALAGGSGDAAGPSTPASPLPSVVLPAVSVLGVLEGSSRALGVVFWAGILVCALALDWWGRRLGSRTVSAGRLLRLVWAQPVLRVVAVAGWLVAGWHLFAH